MKELRPLYQLAIILDSILILVLVVLFVVQPRFQSALPLAGLLAGLNAMLHSRVLDGLKPAMKRLLLWGGLAAMFLMATIAVVRFVP